MIGIFWNAYMSHMKNSEKIVDVSLSVVENILCECCLSHPCIKIDKNELFYHHLILVDKVKPVGTGGHEDV